jgi:hypothetical protein
VESGKLWYLDISNFLTTLGFNMSAHDECLFTKMVNGRMLQVVIFVDDFLMTASQGADLDSLEDSLRTKYKEITVTEGLVHDYLGMKFDFSIDGKVTISMPNYVHKVTAQHLPKRTSSSTSLIRCCHKMNKTTCIPLSPNCSTYPPDAAQTSLSRLTISAPE